nr:hypothetical protein [Tanacetum cinerariifolium]
MVNHLPYRLPSIPTPPPPTPPITRQRPANLRQNPKQRVPYNPSANHATILPTTITEPTSFIVANNSPEWRQAMKEEYDALMKNRTWSLVHRASNTNIVDGKWVYRLKRDKNGAITPYKARFVAKGFRQQPDWPLRQLDIQNALLHGNLKEQVYMKQPPGFIDPQRPNHVCLLHKSLYSLKQAPHARFERLSKALFDLGNNKGTIDNIICQLGSAFALKDLGPLNYFLGIEIVPHVSGILISQKKYILKLLQSVGLSNCNLVSSPMVTSSSLSLDDSTTFSNPVKYRQVVGSLQYVTLSRHDIAFAVKKVIPILLLKLSQMIRRSTGRFAIYLGSNLISRTARKQRTVSRSSTEAEYKALPDSVAELTWHQALLNELEIRSSSTPILWCDNLGDEALKELQKLTLEADKVQEDLLKSILTRNKMTEYLQKYMTGVSMSDVREFKQRVPVITYKDIYPYIKRIAIGEESSVISGHPITEMLSRYVTGLDE